jgi:hypothetical protein
MFRNRIPETRRSGCLCNAVKTSISIMTTTPLGRHHETRFCHEKRLSSPRKVPEFLADLSSAPFERFDRFDQDFYTSFG